MDTIPNAAVPHRVKFRSSPIAACLLVPLAPFSAQVAFSQAADGAVPTTGEPRRPARTPELVLEEVIVTGVRGSLLSAQEAKRDANVIADFVTQEDVGRYTDQNLAESLQRVPGVQISRAQSGEGTFVSIRGLGPQFVVTTIAGRSAFGGSGGDDGLGNRNAFSLDSVAPELVAAVEVFKSTRADMFEGGIGGAVNILTARPLDLNVADGAYDDGLYAAINYDATYAVEPEEVDPRVSGLLSWKSADGTLGLLGTVAYYDRTTLTQISRLITTDFDDTIGGVDNVFRPSSDSEYAMNDGSIERLGYGLSAQWRPSETFELTLDYLGNDQLMQRYQNTLRMRLPGDISQLVENPVVTRINAPGVGGILSSGIIRRNDALPIDQPAASIAPAYSVYDRDEASYGAHMKWQPVNSLTVDLDAAYFESEFARKDDIAAYDVLGVNGFDYQADGGDGLPVFRFLPDPVTGAQFDVGNLQLGDPVDFGFNRIFAGGDERAFRLDLDWQIDRWGISTLEFGLSNRRRSQDQLFNVFRYSRAGLDALLQQAGIDPATTPDFAQTARRSIPLAHGGFLSEASGIPYPTWFALDARSVIGFYRPSIESSLGGASIDDRRAGPALGFQFGPFGGNGAFEGVQEDNAAYLIGNFDAHLFGVPFNANLGVRAVDTKFRGEGQRTAGAIDPATGNTVALDANGNPITTSSRAVDKGGRSEILPSGNINFLIDPAVNLRFAASKVVTPPDLSLVAGPSSVGFDTVNGTTITAVNIGRPNPDLDPFEANQYDAIIEWYPSDTQAIFALGFFYKDIKSLIVTQTTFPDTYELDGVTYAAQENLQLRVSQPTNGAAGGAIVSGLEAQAHVPFNWFISHRVFANFGVQATYTHLLKNETSVKDAQTGEALPFEGASEDNYSVVGYYDDGRLSSRVSYTYRSEAFTGQATGGGLFNDDYATLDANIDYRLTENIALRFQATNLLEEPFRQTVVGGRTPYIYSQNGRLYILGARVQF